MVFCNSISILEILSVNDATRRARFVLSVLTSSAAANLTSVLFDWPDLLLLGAFEALDFFAGPLYVDSGIIECSGSRGGTYKHSASKIFSAS